MGKQSRRKFSAEFKAWVALEAIKEQKTISELSHQFEVHPVTISKWKSEFLQNMAAAFDREGRPGKEKESKDLDKLYAQIGQLKVENDFLKKVAGNWAYPTANGNDQPTAQDHLPAAAVRYPLYSQKFALLPASG